MKLYSTLFGAALMVVSVGGVAQAAEAVGGSARTSVSEGVWIRFAPPVARYEYYGRKPSHRHFWVNGHQRWSGRDYVWVPGRWDVHRDGYVWVQPRYHVVNGHYRFVPGHWR